MTRDSYVPRAVSIHGDKYGYDMVPSEFRATDKIKIFCKECEEYFTCTARNHTNSKSGCPICGRKLANSDCDVLPDDACSNRLSGWLSLGVISSGRHYPIIGILSWE